METSFTLVDKEIDNHFGDHLNSTAVHEDGVVFIPPKTPQRDNLKISPIPKDECRSVFHRKMVHFHRIVESPLAKPRNLSTLEMSHLVEFESGYNTKDDETALETSNKENNSFRTPGRRPQSMLRNPFEHRILEDIHTSTLSPNLTEIFPSPKDKPWPIEHRSILCPANITDEDIRMSRSLIDPDIEEKVERRLEIYWENGGFYIPSPDGPRPVIDHTPSKFSMKSEFSSVRRRESPAARPLAARRRTITLRNSSVQTDFTIPPDSTFDFAKILGQNFCYTPAGNEVQEEEFNMSLNTSLPRRLFEDTSFLDDSFLKENTDTDNDNVKEDLDNSMTNDHTGIAMKLDISPIKSE